MAREICAKITAKAVIPVQIGVHFLVVPEIKTACAKVTAKAVIHTDTRRFSLYGLYASLVMSKDINFLIMEKSNNIRTGWFSAPFSANMVQEHE